MKLNTLTLKNLIKKILIENTQLFEQAPQVTDAQFRTAIVESKVGDKFRITFKKNVYKNIEELGGQTRLIFKAGETYEGEVLEGDAVEVSHESVAFQTRTDMSKEDFIAAVQEQAEGDPCTIVDCDASTVTRGSAKKTFSGFLKNPRFEKTKKISRKERIAKIRAASNENDAQPQYQGRSNKFYSATLDCKDKYEPLYKDVQNKDEEYQRIYKKHKDCLDAADKKYPKKRQSPPAPAEEEIISISIDDASLAEVLESYLFKSLNIETLADVSDVMVTATVKNMPASRALISILKPLAEEGAIVFNWGEDGKFTIWKPEAEEEAATEPSEPPTRPPRQRTPTRSTPRSRKPSRTPSSPIGPPSGTGTLMHMHKGGQKLKQTPEEVKLCMKYPDHYIACFQSLVDQGYQPAIELQKQGKKTKSGLRESTAEKAFSSFPEHQKLFENWNKYLKEE